ncbi:MAG: penicillin-binding protein 2 [Thermoanaerobaculia bacterium]|nr:penicillin-binding protein 2 [Thermoanaerobaculia bacterium]
MEVREHREELLKRIPALRISFLTLLVAIGAAYWFVQVIRGEYYRELAENNRLRRIPVQPIRGLIFDREGRLLVDNVPSYNLRIDRSRSADVDRSLRFAAETLERPLEELAAQLDRQASAPVFTPVLLAESLSLSQVARFSTAALEHPEFEIDVGHLRLYRHGPMTAHLLGYLGEVTEQDLREGKGDYRPGDLRGKRGIERAFDGELQGERGQRQVIVDSRGRVRDDFATHPARPGRNLRLELDLELQQVAARYLGERVGAAVALDPRDGAVLVMASSPTYNPNLFARRLDRSEWQRLVEAPHDPLQNRVIQNTFAPGSVYKVVVAVAGLMDRAVSPSETVYCGGATRIYNRRFRCWYRAGHGRVNLREAIKRSCDVYFYYLGQKLGITRIAHYSRLFGLGRETGLDLGGERAGLVPDLEWSLGVRGSTWYPGETISVAIGQGPLLVTPLQVATMMAVVANGGHLVTPRVLASSPPAPPRETGLDPEALAFVDEALWAVVNEAGTGAAAKVPGFDIAGKTGTAQVFEQKTWLDNEDLPFEKRDHAWFAAYGPGDDPTLVVVVLVQHGGEGSRQAAPLARMIYEKYFDDRQPVAPS